MLVPVCKMLAHGRRMPSTNDVLETFFHHYARLDWKEEMVFDPFFHKHLKYRRTFREPLCLLGWHAPSFNRALNASQPTVKTLAVEFARAIHLLSRDVVRWTDLLGSNRDSHELAASICGADYEFRQSFESYVSIDAHYWGSSPTKANRFLGWVESR